MTDENSELEPIRGRLYAVSHYAPTGPVSKPVSEWVTLRRTDDPEYSHEGVAVCQLCEAVVTIRLPRALDARSRLARARSRIIKTIAVPLALVLTALFLILDPLRFDQDGLIVLGIILGILSGLVLVVSPGTVIRQAPHRLAAHRPPRASPTPPLRPLRLVTAVSSRW